jgi:hypothetical protein
MKEEFIANIDKHDEIPTIELKFSRKVKRIRLLSAVLCIILTLVLSYAIYTTEYKYNTDKASLSSAITEFKLPSENAVDAYVTATKEINGILFASFKDKTNGNVNGIAKFLKGVNQKYRIVDAKFGSSKYSSVVQFYPVEIKDKEYIAVSGYNLSDEIKYYGLNYAAYTTPDYLSKNRVKETLKFQIKDHQFLEFYQTKELVSLLENSAGKNLYNYFLIATSMYNTNGIEITENYRNMGDNTQDISYSVGKAELFLLYVYIAIVIVLGIILTRYFLSE